MQIIEYKKIVTSSKNDIPDNKQIYCKLTIKIYFCIWWNYSDTQNKSNYVL